MPLTGEPCIELIEQKGEYLFQEDRKKLIEDALGEFVLSEKILITDREFLGDEWPPLLFKFLTNNHIDFAIRVCRTCHKNPVIMSWGKSNAYLENEAQKRKDRPLKLYHWKNYLTQMLENIPLLLSKAPK